MQRDAERHQHHEQAEHREDGEAARAHDLGHDAECGQRDQAHHQAERAHEQRKAVVGGGGDALAGGAIAERAHEEAGQQRGADDPQEVLDEQALEAVLQRRQEARRRRHRLQHQAAQALEVDEAAERERVGQADGDGGGDERVDDRDGQEHQRAARGQARGGEGVDDSDEDQRRGQELEQLDEDERAFAEHRGARTDQRTDEAADQERDDELNEERHARARLGSVHGLASLAQSARERAVANGRARQKSQRMQQGDQDDLLISLLHFCSVSSARPGGGLRP